PLQRVLADGKISGDGKRLEQRESFPRCPLRLVVELERAERIDDGTAASFGPEVEIDAEDERRGADRARHFLGEARVEGEVIDRLRSVRSALPVVHVEQIDVAGEVELGTTELSHAQHAEAAGSVGGASLR